MDAIGGCYTCFSLAVAICSDACDFSSVGGFKQLAGAEAVGICQHKK